MQFTKKIINGNSMNSFWNSVSCHWLITRCPGVASSGFFLLFFFQQSRFFTFVCPAQLLKCSASQRPRQLIMDMAKISPEAQTQAAFIQLQTTGHSLKMGAPRTGHRYPAQPRPDETRRDETVYPLFTWPDKIASATGRGGGWGRGGSEEPKNGFFWRVC